MDMDRLVLDTGVPSNVGEDGHRYRPASRPELIAHGDVTEDIVP
jgi:hypothetical protein